MLALSRMASHELWRRGKGEGKGGEERKEGGLRKGPSTHRTRELCWGEYRMGTDLGLCRGRVEAVQTHDHTSVAQPGVLHSQGI